jgi:uncharacterized protein DUF4149
VRSDALPRRAAAWLAGVWAGAIAALGFVAAPVLFATLPRAQAGDVAAHVFAADAAIGLVIGALVLVLTLNAARREAESGRGSRFSVEMVLVLVALACIVAGHYALAPLLESARGSGGRFALLHAVATVLFVVKLAAIALLAWRLAGGGAAANATTAPTS